MIVTSQRAIWWVIARRELTERLRSRWFIVTTILGPLLLIGAMAVPVLIASSGGNFGARIALVDDSSGVGPSLSADLSGLGWRVTNVAAETPEPELLQQIADDKIDGFLRLPADLVAGQGKAVYNGDNASSMTTMAMLSDRLARTVTSLRLSNLGLARSSIQVALQHPSFEARHTTGRSEGTRGDLVFVLGYAVVLILYMSIVIYAVNVMRAVVVEKTNKVIEVLLAAVKPEALMLGKILGVGLAGLLQVGLWTTVILAFSTFGGGLFGAAMPTLPSVDLAAMAVILAYFVLGYFFFAALYAAIGAMVSSEQEAQQAQGPVVIILVIPISCIQLVANDPRGNAAELLTQIPITSPFLMPMRYLLDGASFGSLFMSLAILTASTWLLTLVAARIFRVGILMTGKRPSLRELWHWVRHP